MKTLSARALRFANLFAFAAALVAVCPRATYAENGGPMSPDMPPPCAAFPDGTFIIATSSTNLPDGSITYNNATVTLSDGTSKSAAWANVSTSGAILYSDGTTGHI